MHEIQDLGRVIEQARATAPRQRAALATSGIAARAVGRAPEPVAAGAVGVAGAPLDPNSVAGQVLRTWKAFVEKLGGNQTLAASVVFIVGWWVGRAVLGGRGCVSVQGSFHSSVSAHALMACPSALTNL